MAPEVWQGHRYSAKVDHYSLGCILYYMITCNEYIPGRTNTNQYEPIDKRYPKVLPLEIDNLDHITNQNNDNYMFQQYN